MTQKTHVVVLNPDLIPSTHQTLPVPIPGDILTSSEIKAFWSELQHNKLRDAMEKAAKEVSSRARGKEESTLCVAIVDLLKDAKLHRHRRSEIEKLVSSPFERYEGERVRKLRSWKEYLEKNVPKTEVEMIQIQRVT